MSLLIVVGNAEPYYNSYGTRILGYRVNMQHDGLHEFKILSAPDLDSTAIRYKPQLGLFDKIFPSRKQFKIAEVEKIFNFDIYMGRY